MEQKQTTTSNDALQRVFGGLMTGIVVAGVIKVFCVGLELATNIRLAHLKMLLPCLGIAAMLAALIYEKFGKGLKNSKSLMLSTMDTGEPGLDIKIAPLAMIVTWISHLFGGSCGKEGVATQIGATLSYNIGKKYLHVEDGNEVFSVAGVAAGFAAIFQTPLAGIAFALEMCKNKKVRIRAFIPTVIAAFVAEYTGSLLGIPKEAISLVDYELTGKLLLHSLLFGIIAGLIGFIFRKLHEFLHYFIGSIKCNQYIKVFVIGSIIAAVMVATGGRYSGTGENLIELAFEGGKIYEYDYILKLILTALTLSIGLQGGENKPLFAIGSCLGALHASAFGLPMQLAAALGFVGVFGAGTNSNIAAFFIAFELFGAGDIVLFIPVCLASIAINLLDRPKKH